MPEKIHCDLLEIIGPDWASMNATRVQCVIDRVRNMELLGEDGEMYGFVGAANVDNVVGGFFAIQFPAEFIKYDRHKELSLDRGNPFERLFFILFPSGKLLMQNRRFRVIPIDMSAAISRFQKALSVVLQECNIGFVLNFAIPSVTISRSELIEMYHKSSRVERLSVINPDGEQIPEDITYYNPERQRNKIVRGSHVHDSSRLKKLDMEAQEGIDLRETHLGKGFIYAVKENEPFLMVAIINNQERHIRPTGQTKFELNIDMDANTLDPERLKEVVAILRRDSGIDLDIPVIQEGPRQMSLYETPTLDEEDDEDNEQHINA
jgi:hypothetical protein